MQCLGLFRVTAGAGCSFGNSGAGVRFVAGRAFLMSARRAAHLLAVTGATSGRFCGVMRVGPVARSAVLMTAVLGRQSHLAAVARPAQRGARGQRETVRLVATRAGRFPRVGGGLRRGDLLMTARAGACLRVDFSFVRHMAVDAVRLAAMHGVHLLVTDLTRALGLRRRVRRVTARASGMGGNRRGEQRGLGPVASEAHPRALRHEIVWLVTGETRVVVGWLRAGRLLMAGRAGRSCRARRVVAPVAIEAIFASYVLGVVHRAFLVTIGARFRRDGGRRVRVVAFVASRRQVHAHRGGVSLGLAVTVAAGRRGSRCEEMTGQTIGLPLAARVGVGDLLIMASRAHADARILEAFGLVVVAVLAADRSLADVLLVPDAGAELGPGSGHDLGRDWSNALLQRAEEPSYARADQKQDRGRARKNSLGGRGHHTPP